MPPGFANQCPYGLELPIPVMPWVLGAWVAVYALSAETALLGLGLLILRLRRVTVSRSASASLLLVAGCAGGALVVAEWITNRNIQLCFAIPFTAHPTLAQDVRLRRLYAQLLMQAQIALGVLAVTVILATALTMMTCIRHWRGNRRRSETASA